MTQYTIDVSEVVDKLDKKHAIFLVAESNSKEKLCVLQGLGFSKKGKSLEYPTVPTVEIMVDGKKVDLPTTPVRSTNAMVLPDLISMRQRTPFLPVLQICLESLLPQIILVSELTSFNPLQATRKQ